MTITEQSATAAATENVPGRTVEILASVLLRGLHNACLFMSDALKPDLNGVRFEVTNGKLTLVSTNSSQLFSEELECIHEGDVEFAFFLSAREVKTLMAAHKASKWILTLAATDGAVTVAGDSTTVHQFYDPAGAGFPESWRMIVPVEGSTVPTCQILMDAALLAKIVRIKAEGMTTIRFELAGENKPAVVRVPNGPTVVTMPMRLR